MVGRVADLNVEGAEGVAASDASPSAEDSPAAKLPANDKDIKAASPSEVELKSRSSLEVEEDVQAPVQRLDTRVIMQMEQAKRFGFAMNVKPITEAERTASTQSQVDKQRAEALKRQRREAEQAHQAQYDESDHEISDDELRASSH